jgi:hypothetical protein
LLVKRDLKLIVYLILMILCTSYYFLPLLYDKLFISGFRESSANPGIIGTISSFFSFVPSDYSWENDFNYGPFIFFLALISTFLFFFSIESKGLRINKNLNTVALIILITAYSLILLFSYFSPFRDSVPSERIGFYIQVFFYIIIGYIFSKFKLNFLAPIILIIIGAFLTPNTELYIGIFTILLLFFLFKLIIEKNFSIKFTHIIGLLFLWIILLPSVNFFNETNVIPRIWCYYFPENLLDSNNVYLTDIESYVSFSDLYGARIGRGIGSAGGTGNFSLDYTVNDDGVLGNLELLGITKIIAWRNYPHLNDWFQDSEDIIFGRLETDYFFTFYNTNFNNLYNNIQVLSPTHLIVNTSEMNFIPVYYHPFWTSDSALYDYEGYVGFDNQDELVELRFDTRLFTFSNFLSLFSFVVLLLFFNRKILL